MTDKWIQGAIKNKGSLKSTAKKHNAIDKEGNIKKGFIEKASKGDYGAKTEKRAQLAKTLSKLKKGK